MADIVRSTRDYEAWLCRQLGRALVENDLGVKHKKMCESPFAFLRATYWRWAETVLDVCPEAGKRPEGAGGWRYSSRELRNMARCRRSPRLGCERL